ncbi:peptidoglycan-binding protein [Streptomyces sp. NPDC059740]|uniref:peptidoglycan-binding protein n=1 Tax=Streptomyces sp. NPDC059740 TaxID=3346926 RepID=UPI0036650957
MPRWKELPGSLDEPVRALVVQMRRLKDHSGLSLVSLQSRTGYSRSSWERYLNGRSLPPREAVEKLARVGRGDPAPLLALHEVAEGRWKAQVAGRADQGQERRPGAPDTSRPHTASHATNAPEPGGRRRRLALAGVCTVLLLGGLLAVLLVSAPWKGNQAGHGRTVTGQSATAPSGAAFAYRAGKTYPCSVRRRNGRLYAGYSTTRTALLSAPGWDVVEAQCLLEYHGFDPGGVDGVIGPNTTRAAKRLQEKAGLTPDGLVGADTWRVLRQ